FTDNLYFRFQLDPARSPGLLPDEFNQREDILRRRAAFIDDEIPVHVGNDRAADAGAFQSEFVDQFARRDDVRVFEDAARAGSRRLAGPPFPTEGLHPFFDRLAGGPFGFEDRAERDVILEERTTAILDVDLTRRALAHGAQIIHEADGLDDVEHPQAHCARVHAQRAADASGNPFEKLQARQAPPLCLESDRLEPGARAAVHPVADHLDAAEIR